jgi:hypothetical protein
MWRVAVLLEFMDGCGNTTTTRGGDERAKAGLYGPYLCSLYRMIQLARDNAIGKSTGHGYLHVGIGVLAARAPSLHGALLAAGHGRPT